MFIRNLMTAWRMKHKRAMYGLMRDGRVIIRMNFLYAALNAGLLEHLHEPASRDELIVRLGVKRPELLDVLLDLGLSLGELAFDGTRYRVRGRLSRVLMREDGDSLAGELLFRAFTAVALVEPRLVAGWFVARVSETPPADPGRRVLNVQCRESPSARLFQLDDLGAPLPPVGTPVPAPNARRVAARPEQLLPLVNYLVVCGECLPPELRVGFTALGKRGACDELYVRTPRAVDVRR